MAAVRSVWRCLSCHEKLGSKIPKVDSQSQTKATSGTDVLISINVIMEPYHYATKPQCRHGVGVSERCVLLKDSATSFRKPIAELRYTPSISSCWNSECMGCQKLLVMIGSARSKPWVCILSMVRNVILGSANVDGWCVLVSFLAFENHPWRLQSTMMSRLPSLTSQYHYKDLTGQSHQPKGCLKCAFLLDALAVILI